MAFRTVAAEILTLAGTAFMVARSVGGHRGLRNPWVWGALAVGFLGASLFFGAAVLVWSSHRDLSTNLGIGAFAILLCSLGWAWAAGMRRVAAIGRLLGLGKVEPLSGVHSEVFPEDVIPSLTRERLYELLALIEPTRGAPGFEWLTPNLVHERLNQLASSSSGQAQPLRAGGA